MEPQAGKATHPATDASSVAAAAVAAARQVLQEFKGQEAVTGSASTSRPAPTKPVGPVRRATPLPSSNLTNTKVIPGAVKQTMAKERSANARAALRAGAVDTDVIDGMTFHATGADSSDEEGAHAPTAAPAAARRKGTTPPQPAAPPKPAVELQPATKPEHQRDIWAERHESSDNSFFADEPAFVNPLNTSLPLQVCAPCACPAFCLAPCTPH